MNIDKDLEKIRKCQFLEEKEMKRVLRAALELFSEEENVVYLKSPIIVCGDIHGQFYDLLTLFKISGDLPKKKYVFLGDFVDRGFHSLESITLLLLLKLKYPDRITLLRGNHESRLITQTYGFYRECSRKYGSNTIWNLCCSVFDCFNVAAIIDNKVFCVHGGLSPALPTVDKMKRINRRREVPQSGPFTDLLWADPEDRIDGWNTSNRGTSFVFGKQVTKEFNHVNGFNLICRAHQVIQKGYKYHFDKMVVTIWSAPNYAYKTANLASVMEFKDDNSEPNPIIFKENVERHKEINSKLSQRPLYFL